jgi:alpha-tubulin suppressor-like RCC1 family protein
VACGNRHTIVVAAGGCLFVFGDNSKGQLGIGKTALKNIAAPVMIDELNFTKITTVRAGAFSGCLSEDG